MTSHRYPTRSKLRPGAHQKTLWKRPFKEFPKRGPQPKLQPQSRLLNLPAELRNEIYRFALTDSHGIGIRCDNPYYCSPTEVFDALDLLTACKQIRREALPIFYGENSFYVIDDTDILPEWLRDIGQQKRQLIKSLCVSSCHYSLDLEELYRQMRAVQLLPVPQYTRIRARLVVNNYGSDEMDPYESVQFYIERHQKRRSDDHPNPDQRSMGSPFRIIMTEKYTSLIRKQIEEDTRFIVIIEA